MDEDFEYKTHYHASKSSSYVNAFTFAYVATMLLLTTVIIVYLLTHTR